MVGVCELSVLHIISKKAHQGLPHVDTCPLETVNHYFMLSPWGWSYSLCWSVQHGKGHPRPGGSQVLEPVNLCWHASPENCIWPELKCEDSSVIIDFPHYCPYFLSPRKEKLEFQQGTRALLGGQFTALFPSCNTELQNRTRHIANTHWSSSCFS